MTRLRYLSELVAAALCWGSGNVLVKYALHNIPAMTLLMIEVVFATVLLWLVLLLRGYRRPAGLGRLVLLGLFEPGLTYAAVDLGLNHTSASDASLLSGTESVFVVILAAVFLKQRLSWSAVFAVLLATVGVAALSGSAPSLAAGWGNLLVLTGALCAAIYVTLASTVAPESDAVTMTAFQFLAGALACLPFAAIQWGFDGKVWPTGASPGEWTAAVAAGVIGLATSFLLYNHAISRVNVTTAGMILNLIPLFGLAGAVLALSESITTWQLIGAGFILAGLIMFAFVEQSPAEQQSAPARPSSTDALAEVPC